MQLIFMAFVWSKLLSFLNNYILNVVLLVRDPTSVLKPLPSRRVLKPQGKVGKGKPKEDNIY